MNIARNYIALRMGGGGGVSYSLFDNFTTPLAAGNVHNTNPEPGPGGPRYVVDTANKLSINASKKVEINAVGRTTFGDPGIWWGAQSRSVGKCYFGTVNIHTASSNNIIGFDVNQASTATAASIYFAAASITVYDGGTSTVVGAWEVDTDYQCLIVLRKTGSYFLIKGGAYTAWTLLWKGGVGTDASIYPGFCGRDALVYLDDVTIPDLVWVPSPLVFDSFTRNTGALGNSEMIGPDGQQSPVIAWAANAGTVQVNSVNRAVATATSGGIALATCETSGANIVATAKVQRITTGSALLLRYVDTDNYIYAGVVSANTCKLIKRVAGIESDVISGAITYTAGNEFEVIGDGSNWSLFYNKAKVGNTTVIDDAALQSSTKHGVWFGDTDSTIWDVSVFSVGSGGEYTALDNLRSSMSLTLARTAFYGDSITLGTGASDLAHRYSSLVIASRPGWVEVNRGLSGQHLQNTVQNTVATIGAAANNNARDNYAAQLLAYSPDRVFIMFGVNDLRLNDVAYSAANYETDLGEIVDAILAAGVSASNIIICSPTYLPAETYTANAPTYNGGSSVIHAQYVASCAAVALAIISSTSHCQSAGIFPRIRSIHFDTDGRTFASTPKIKPIAKTSKTVMSKSMKLRS